MSGDLSSLKRFAARLREMPQTLANRVAEAAAPVITATAQTTFAAGEDPYGVAWAPGANGERVTLRESGALARNIRYVAIGSKLRCALGVAYAKYQIGKRPVFPTALLPRTYSDALRAVVETSILAGLGGGQ